MSYYFSCITEEREDRSYPSPEVQAKMRLDDLKDVREELMRTGAPARNGCLPPDEVLLFAVPEEFVSPENDLMRCLAAVDRAIALAKEDAAKETAPPQIRARVEPLPFPERMPLKECAA